tara:strand:+ start:2005 stop:2382 length:378 start_codon:yes stop_codon:yes gene_type:complete
MSAGAGIAAEVKAALAEAARDTGDGALEGVIVRRGAASGPSYDPTYGPDEEYVCTCLFAGFTLKEREAGPVEQGDVKLMIAADGLDIEPKTDDRVRVGSETYQIKEVMPLNPGGVVIYWTVRAGK